MNMKNFLLALAGMGFVTTGVWAADTVVLAEPEPVEYVRVCDAYGSGYFYIPGTQTCMRLYGFVRAEITAGDNRFARQLGQIDRDTYAWMTRVHYRFTTATETDLGTLRSMVDIRSQWSNGADGTTGSLRNGWISLGDFRIGVSSTNSFVRWVGNYGPVYQGDILTSNAKRTNFIEYIYSNDNGFSAMLTLEQGSNTADANNMAPGLGIALAPSATTVGNFRNFRRDGTNASYATSNVLVDSYNLSAQMDDYTPNVIGGLKYEQDWGALFGVVAYDSYYEEWAAKLRLNVKVNDHLSLFVMGGYKSHDDYYRIDPSFGVNGYDAVADVYGVYRSSATIYGDWGGDWIVWAGGRYQFNDNRSRFNAQVNYDDTRGLAVVGNFEHFIAPGLLFTTELQYVKWDDRIGYDAATALDGTTSSGVRSSLRGNDSFGVVFRLDRDF